MSGLFFLWRPRFEDSTLLPRPPSTVWRMPAKPRYTHLCDWKWAYPPDIGSKARWSKKTSGKPRKKMLKSTRPNYHLSSEVCLELSGYFAEGSQISAKLANIMKERTVETTELYTAMSRLTVSEFNRTYASFKRDTTRQIQHELAQDTERAKGAPAKLPRRFWKRMFKILARP